MSTTLETKLSESRLKVYLKAFGFVLPALLAGQFVNVFVLPKLVYVQRDAGLSETQLSGMMNLAQFLSQHGTFMLWAMAGAILVMEWRARFWSRYRKPVLSAVVFVINTAVLLELTTLTIAATVMAPILLHK